MVHNRKTWLSLPMPERIELVKNLYSSHVGEQCEIASYLLHLSIPLFESNQVLLLDQLADHFQGWGTVDDFCINVLQPLLLKFPHETTQLIKQWNQSENPWKRRASMVVFVRKIGLTDHYTDLCLELAENLLFDTHDLVLKGVGWALKDTMRGNQEKVLAYVKNLRQRKISSIITLYAIRDIKGKERQDILAIK
ncbi:MAG: hypothetical protein CL609_04740 [Anaerolineaceae bacterium]|nr:hypothetical protein [Anaerolineaceae bacterium]